MGDLIHLHRGVRPIAPRHIANAVPGAYRDERGNVIVIDRRPVSDAELAAEAERICASFNGPPRHERIGPTPHPIAMTALDVIACAVVFGTVCAALAIGGAL